MKRFDVYLGPGGSGYLLVVQSHRILGLATQVVVPLLPKSKAPQPADRLHPTFRIGDADFVMATHLLSAIPASELAHNAGSLVHAADEIIAALDMLFSGI